MAHVEVKAGSTPSEKSGVSRASGKPYTMRTQDVWFHPGDGSIFRIQYTLGREEKALSAGVYDIAPQSWGVSSFNDLVLKRLVLVPRVASEQRPAAAAPQARVAG